LHKEQLPLENGGIASRDFVFVDDLVEGLCLATRHGTPGEVYNLASGMETRIIDLANLINRLTGNEAALDIKPPRDWDRSIMRIGSTEKSKQLLGFEARTKIEEGLTKTVDWTKANYDVIARSVGKHQYFLAHPQKYPARPYRIGGLVKANQ
jgi:nucleoside-diphosphate-sugar epimerase